MKEEGESFVPIQSQYSSERQMKVDRYYLDGFLELECGKRVCYEFYGCYYHGCIVCFPDRNKVIRKSTGKKVIGRCGMLQSTR